MDLTPGEDQRRSDESAARADMRIEVVKRELNQGALSGFDSSVTDYAAKLVIAALDSFDEEALKAEFRKGFEAGEVNGALLRETDEVRRTARRLCARIIASAHLLDVPFTDAPDRSPWTQMKRDMAALYAALGIQIGNQPRTLQEPSPSEHTQDGGERRGLDPETLPQWERELLERQRWYPKPPADTSWISVAVEYRRPWWRRLLRLPAKREDRGTFAVEAWGEVGQTPPGGTMNVPESGE